MTYIIAELSANHGGELTNAINTVHAAKECGADAIKIQTCKPELITLDCNKSDFIVSGGTLWDDRSLYSLYSETYTPWEWHEAIFNEAKKVGIDCFSSPFDCSAVDFLETLDNPIYKIASFEITDIPLISHVASKGKPIIISTGIATIEDINLALDTCYAMGNTDITLLKCTSAYPASISDANLATMLDMKTRFDVKIGLSDHTLGYDVAVAAVALGAQVVEKHFIINREIGGPDAEFSMDMKEFKQMVKAIRNVEKAIGRVDYPTELHMIKGREYCRSLYVAEDIIKGETITERNVRSVRPGYGLHPKYLPQIIGKQSNVDLNKGTRFSLEFISTNDID